MSYGKKTDLLQGSENYTQKCLIAHISIIHISICVNFFLLQNCQNGLVFVNFNLKLLLGCYPSHFHFFPLILLYFV